MSLGAEFFNALLLLNEPVYLVVDSVLEAEIRKSEIEELFMKRA